MKLRDRCTQPIQVYLQEDQRRTLLAALRIATEDESIFGGWLPGEQEYENQRRIIGDLEFKLRNR